MEIQVLAEGPFSRTVTELIFHGRLLVAERVTDQCGKPVENEAGYAQAHYRYDERGLLTSVIWEDRDGRPVVPQCMSYIIEEMQSGSLAEP